jgi:two-component system response regulator YesN
MYKVLIVDDEEDTRIGLKILIDWEKQGFIVSYVAVNGIEALEVYQSVRPSLVITDIKMPVMDGLELSRQIRSLNDDVKIIILSGYSDFALAKEAIKFGVKNYLLKPVDETELITALEEVQEELFEQADRERESLRNLEKLRNYFMVQWVQGRLNQKRIETEAKLCNLVISGEWYVCLVLELEESLDKSLNPFKDDPELRLFALRNIINDILRGVSGGIVFQSDDVKLGVLLYGNPNQYTDQYISKLCSRIIINIKKYAKHDIDIGIGKKVQHINEVAESYKQAEQAFDMKFYSHTNRFYLYEELQVSENAWSIPWSSQNLIDAVDKRIRVQISDEIELLFEQIKKSRMPIHCVNQLMDSVMLQIAKTTTNSGGDWKTIFKNHFHGLTDIVKKQSMSQLQDSVLQIVLAACEAIDKTRLKERDFTEIIEYIQQHYNADLNLTQLSNLFYINTSYLGKRIKKEIGISFNDYLNQIRVEHAVALLQNSTMSISEISEKVGYNYIDYFYKVFKHAKGYNPGEYRRVKLEGNG